MPNFSYLARDPAGRMQQGTLDAASLSGVAESLRGRGWRVLRIDPLAAPMDWWATAGQALAPAHWWPIRSLDVELSLGQIALMLRSGLTLLSALKTVAEQTRRARLKRVWETVVDDIQGGSSFTDALAAHACFPPLVVQLVRVGEQTGTLDQVLDRATKALVQRRAVVTSLLTALAYPAIVLLAAIGVSIFMVVKVLPELQKFLRAMGRKLPAITQALLDVSGWLQAYGLYVVAAICCVGGAVVLAYMSPAGRLTMDRWLLRVPLVGHVLRLASTTTFSNSLALLLRSGITLLDGLRTVEQLHLNRYLSQCVSQARDAVLRGGNLATAMSAPHAYTSMLPRMIAVGEAAGTLEEVLDEVARFHDDQLQVAIRRLSALVEPAVIVLVGGMVGFVYLAFFMALFAAGGMKV